MKRRSWSLEEGGIRRNFGVLGSTSAGLLTRYKWDYWHLWPLSESRKIALVSLGRGMKTSTVKAKPFQNWLIKNACRYNRS